MGMREDAGKTHSAVGRSALGGDERQERTWRWRPGVRVKEAEGQEGKSNLGQGYDVSWPVKILRRVILNI
jgi:hypothetical protein